MKSLFRKAILPLALFGATLVASGAAYVWAPSYIDGTTNTVVVAGTNAIVSYVPLGTTNFYLMPNQAATGANTNLYQAYSVLPNNNINPIRNVTFQAICTGTNAGVVTFRFAQSTDNSHWQSNAFWFAMTMNGTGLAVGNPVYAITNCDTYAIPFMALQSIECPNGYATNIYLQSALKPTW